MDNPRRFLCASMIDDDNLICCSGAYTGNGLNLSVQADIYDFNSKKWIKIANMNQARYRAGICVDKTINKRVYVGGGLGTDFEASYYDITKNKWYELPKMHGEHYRWPIMWVENANTVHITSAYGQLIERFDIRLNKWEIYLQNKRKGELDKLFGANFGNAAKFRLCV